MCSSGAHKTAAERHREHCLVQCLLANISENPKQIAESRAFLENAGQTQFDGAVSAGCLQCIRRVEAVEQVNKELLSNYLFCFLAT